MSNQCQICQFKCQFNVRSHICAINSGKGNITCNLRVFDICGSVDAKIIYFKQRKKYQIDLTVIWQLNWPIWQWSDNWIDQFDNADHITNIAKIDTWFDTSDLIVKSSVNSISKIIISYYEKISNWIDIDLILNWPIWPKQIDTLYAAELLFFPCHATFL